MSTIKIMALGGVRENGKNLYVAEVNEHIFVLDAGAKYQKMNNLVWILSFRTLNIWKKISTV